MALSRMRDIAGTRVVEEMNRKQQDVLVTEIVDAVIHLGPCASSTGGPTLGMDTERFTSSCRLVRITSKSKSARNSKTNGPK